MSKLKWVTKNVSFSCQLFVLRVSAYLFRGQGISTFVTSALGARGKIVEAAVALEPAQQELQAVALGEERLRHGHV